MSTTEPNKRNVEGWVSRSFLIPGIDKYPVLTYNFQALGILDCQLSEEWTQILRDPLILKGPTQKFSNHAHLSSLWVLGGYELLRFAKEKNGIDQNLRRVHDLFKRVRIPIAKFDTPRFRNGDPVYPTDYGNAYSGINQGEYGWGVGPETFLSRDELAQELYNLS